jgi:hypothetical protein
MFFIKNLDNSFRYQKYAAPIDAQISQSITNRDSQSVFEDVFSGNDIYFTGALGASTGDTYEPHLYSGNNIFVDSNKYSSPTAYKDYFYGGIGINTTILPGNSANYKIAASSTIYNDMTGQSSLNGYMITDNTKNINTLGVNGMTYVQFADKTVKLSDMSTVTAPVTTTHSAVYMGTSDSVTIVDSGTTIYGGKGTETITLANYNTAQSAYNSLGAVPFSNFIHNVSIDQNVGQINLPMPSFFYEFKQAGNTINVYDSTGANLILSGPIQSGSVGTLFSFADGTASAVLSAGKMTLGGTLIGSTTPTFVTPTLNTIIASAPTTTSSQVYMAANDTFNVATSGQTVFGNTGKCVVGIGGTDFTGNLNVYNVTLDQNVSEIDFGSNLSNFFFFQTGNTIKVYDAVGLKVSAPVQTAGTVLSFLDGTATAKLSAGVMTLGGVTVSNVSQTKLSVPGFSTTVIVDGTKATLDGSAGKVNFVVSPGTFSVNISGFKATDHISFANNDIVSVSNTSYSDGNVTLQYSSGGQTEKVNLVGLSATQDAAINAILDLNTVFGAGTVV